MEKIEKSIIQSLELIKQEQNDECIDKQVLQQDDDPDILINDLSELNQLNNCEFDFIRNKLFFDDIYFKHSKLFKVGSKDHSDFWSFLSKYQNLIKKKTNASKNSTKLEDNKFSEVLQLPLKYDKRWRLNFVYKPNKSDETGAYDSTGRKIKFECDEQKLREFEFIIHLYLDFIQKEKVFKKLKQLRQAQANLPIFKYREVILKTIQENQVTIIAGDTGCGKSTQLPRYLLEFGYERIACTQPRRIACMSLAKRVSYETLNEFKSEVAYQVRFDKTRTKHTKILFLTEGVLLRQMQTDPQLTQYDIIVVDEVHERHVFTDFLLGILKCLIKQRQNLKVILMSATINIDLFSNYFDNCVIVKIPGRTYKIDVEYMPANKEKLDPKQRSSNKIDPGPYIRIMQQIDKKYPDSERGDMLIFLSGMTDIQTILEAAKEYATECKRWIVLPLHSSLSIEDQDKVFDIAPEGVRKCILSTNIAETSVTIDGLRFIVDSGKVKEISYDPKYKMQRLQEFWISRASAEQRKGRAGRTGPGVCFRLYSQADYNSFNEFTTPEIRRVPLNSLLLQMISMGLKDVRKFPFVEPPDLESIEHSLNYLKEQNALDESEQLTPMGQMLAELPVDIQIGKMLIMASIFHVVEPIVTMAAALSVQSPLTSNLRCDYESMQKRKELISNHGDPLTLLNAYNEWIQVKVANENSYKWCKRRCLEEQRFYEISKLKKQFFELLQDNYLLRKKNDDSDVSDSDSDEASTRPKASSSYSEKVKKDLKKIMDRKERKRLLDLKKELSNKPKRPKILNMEEIEVDTSNLDQNESSCQDIRDIEFKLMHDLNQLQNKSLSCKKFTLGEVNLLKIILSCGLYPQIAIADELNSYKRESDQKFNSKHKSFVVIHPTSVFSYDPDILQPCDEDGIVKDKMKFSTRHQLIAYVNLFETNKAYFMNCMRVPALQTLLLYSRSLDTNGDCTRILCDEWLEIRFLDSETGQKILSAVLYLRSAIEKLFKIRLEDRINFGSKQEDGEEIEVKQDKIEFKERAKKLEKILKKKLSEFLDSSFMYSIRRVLPAEVNKMFIKNYQTDSKSIDESKIQSEFKKHLESKDNNFNEIKGGYKITSYLTFNCIIPDETLSIISEYSGNMKRHWKCTNCSKEFLFGLMERMHHQVECQETIEIDTSESSDKISKTIDQKEYFCSICNKKLNLTAIEVLKHKRSHTN